MIAMVSERPSSPVPDRRPSLPPAALPVSGVSHHDPSDRAVDIAPDSEPGEASNPNGDRESLSPESREPWLPPPSTGRVGAFQKIADEPATTAEERARALDRGSKPSLRPGRSESVRPLRASESGGRKSRVSTLRQTILSALPSIPMARLASGGPLATLGLVLALGLGVVVFMWSTGRVPQGIRSALHMQTTASPALVPPPLPSIEVAVDEAPFAELKRGRAPISGGVLYIPSSFIARPDGSFDLVVHFHGNTELTTESYEVSQLDAVVAVLNLGAGSGHYEDRFANPSALSEVLTRAADALKERGLPHPKLKRLALVSWSAGYGAIIKILEHPEDAERVDAVILLDGLHVSYREGTHDVEDAPIVGVEHFAERAKRGERLFFVTHSDIEPNGYLGVHATTDFLLGKLGMTRHPVSGTTVLPKLASMEGVLPKDELKPLVPTSEAHEGGLTIRGYAGNDSPTHIEHLVQMSQLALPALVERWQ